MNRGERKNMEKQLSIRKKKETRKEWMTRVSNNIEYGKTLEANMREIRKRQENERADQEANKAIAYIATDLMVNKGMDYVAAAEEAKRQYEESKLEKK